MKIYIVSYKNEERLNRMRKRFEQVGMGEDVVITKEVHVNDERLTTLSSREKYNKIHLRTWTIMLQHMDAIRSFYEGEDSHCIVCEDDIHISKDFSKELEEVVKDFGDMKLDVLMLGYLFPYKISNSSHFLQILTSEYGHTYHHYPDDIWGTQMYMISRSYAKFLLDKFTVDYAYETIDTYPYSCDWIITKNGKRALIVPMLAVEEGINLSEHQGQINFHKRCFEVNYDPNKYI
jgi:GR25 family glycosyltransferase involved in LPS biosynthesis